MEPSQPPTGLYSILVGSENFLRGYLHLLNVHLAKYTQAIGVQLRPPSFEVGRVTRTTPYHRTDKPRKQIPEVPLTVTEASTSDAAPAWLVAVRGISRFEAFCYTWCLAVLLVKLQSSLIGRCRARNTFESHCITGLKGCRTRQATSPEAIKQ